MGSSDLTKKWQQRTFNMYFGVIFGSHCSALFLPLMYYPSIFTCVVSYLHLACFIGMLINSICMGEEQPGQGGRTITNRVLWISNTLLIQSCVLPTWL